MEKRKLNIGCGKDIRKGYINVDYFPEKGVDKTFDLNEFPYPFKNDSFEEIIMQDILEHIDNPVKSLEEIYRISKNKAVIKIRGPHFSSANVWGDLTHKRGFSSTTFDNFCGKKSRSTSLEQKRKINFKIKKVKLYFPAPYRFLGFNFIFSLNPKIYERILYGLFPCGNIYFELEVIKYN